MIKGGRLFEVLHAWYSPFPPGHPRAATPSSLSPHSRRSKLIYGFICHRFTARMVLGFLLIEFVSPVNVIVLWAFDLPPGLER